jgi:predicted small secreted protein
MDQILLDGSLPGRLGVCYKPLEKRSRSMKKLLSIIVFAAALALVLAGCATKNGQVAAGEQSAAEVFERDGQKWVRVLGAGVEFPLLGEWEKASPAYGLDTNGNSMMSLSLIGDNGAMSSINIGKSKANEWHERSEYVPSQAQLFSIGYKVCNGFDSSCSQAILLKNGSLLVKCKNSGYDLWLVVIRESKPSDSALAHGIAYFSTVPNSNKLAGDFETMMHRLEHR